MVCVAIADGLLWGGDAHGGVGVQGTYYNNAEQDVPQSGGGGATSLLSCGRGGAEGGEHVPTLCVAQTKAVGGGAERAHVGLPTSGDAREDHMLATNRTCDRLGPVLVLDVDFGGGAHGTVRWVMKEGVSLEVLHVRRKDMKEYRKTGLHDAEFYPDSCIQVDDEASARKRSPPQVGQADAEDVEGVAGPIGDHEEATKARERSRGNTREGAGQGRKGQGQTVHTVVCAAATRRTEGEGTKYERAVVRCQCGYVLERQHPGRGRTGGPVLEMHQRGRGR